MKKYLIMAYRYGDCKDYSFPIGIYDSEEVAIENAKSHREYRGGKYEHRLYILELSKHYDAEESTWIWVTGDRKGTRD